jgi:hypothetical protein
MRAIAGIIFIVGVVCIVGLPFIGVMLFLWVLGALASFALGGKDK